MRRAHWTTVLLFVELAMGAIDAHATTITLNGTAVVSDTYEGGTVGSAPIAQVGTWVGPTFSRPLGLVTNAASPGPFQGSQYLALTPGGVYSSLGADLTLSLGDVLRFDSMVYSPQGNASLDYPWQFEIYNPANSQRLASFWRYANGTWGGNGIANFIGPTDYADNIWQRWTLDYTVGAASATFTIGGRSATVPMANTSLSGTNYRLAIFTNGSDRPLYLDSVPDGRPANFSTQWVRQRPLTITGLVWDVSPSGYQTTPFDIDKYLGMNMNTVFALNNSVIAKAAADAGVDWQMSLYFARPYEPLGAAHKALVAQTIVNGHATAWYLPDEPYYPEELQNVAEYARWMKTTHPDLLTYVNVGGGDPYSYYHTVVETIRPDLLMFDSYPFRSDGSTSERYYGDLMKVRQATMEHGIPFGGYLHAFHEPGYDARTASESDTRFNGFTLLTAGAKMLNYFFYDYGPLQPYYSTLIDRDGNPTALYYHAAAANLEYVNIGQSLRFLESTGVRFLPGRNTAAGTPHATPTGLTNWAAGAGGDPHILSASVNFAQSGNLGSGKDGFIGFFTDDDGQHYFMLTNLNHGPNLSAAATALSFVLTFDNSVNSIWLFNRLTGLVEEIALTNHVLNWTLPGGTGDLFKYDNGNFAGVSQAVPGDFDGDGDVDGADFVVWQTHFPTASGATLATGDADVDGDVDGADFVVWQTHFPTTPSAEAMSAPEPSSLLLSVIVGLPLIRARFIRRHCAMH